MTATIPLWQAIAALVVVWTCLILLTARAWYLLCEFNHLLSESPRAAQPGSDNLTSRGCEQEHPVPRRHVVPAETSFDAAVRRIEESGWPVENFSSPAHRVRRSSY